jgi:hypothetical protein
MGRPHPSRTLHAAPALGRSGCADPVNSILQAAQRFDLDVSMTNPSRKSCAAE